MQIVAGSSQQLNIGNKIKSLRSEKIYRKVAFCQESTILFRRIEKSQTFLNSQQSYVWSATEFKNLQKTFFV
ncbi:hypothetical protein NC652_003412 [Populus alba x Populus x berolinensis]|nr:hypothetical protein NC652_003412 [Populus alba x Populus x berolinensis]